MDYSRYESNDFERFSAFNLTTGNHERSFQAHWHANVDTFSVKLSNINGRIDASYHVPIVDAILKHMKT